MRAAIYARVSTLDQAERQTIESQLYACRQYAERQGWQVAEEVKDEGVSGAVPFDERPGGQRLKVLAESREVERIVILSVDRLARNTEDVTAHNRLHKLLAPAPDRRRRTPKGIDEAWSGDGNGETYVHYVTQSFDGSPAGELMFSMFLAVAKYERSVIRQRTMSGREKRVREGKYQAPTTPFGYRPVKETGTIEPDPETAPIVRQMFEWARAGEGTKAIATRLDEAGLMPPMVGHPRRKGAYPKWNFSTIYKMLTARRYVGEAKYGKGKMMCPPLIDLAAFEQVQEALKNRKRDSARNTKHEYLLQHILYCGACGNRYTARTGGNGTRRYACYHRSVFGKAAGHEGFRWSYTAEELEARVLDEATRLLENPEAATLGAFQMEPDAYLTHLEERIAERDRLAGELEEIENRRQRVISLYTRGLIDDADVEHQNKVIKAEAGRTAAALRELQRIPYESLKKGHAEFIGWLNGMSAERAARRGTKALTDASFEERREVIQRLWERITIETDGSLSFVSRVPSVLMPSR